MEQRIIGNNLHGNENEIVFVNYLNNKKYIELNNNLREFIRFICLDKAIHLDDNTLIRASLEKNNSLKQDFYIRVDNNEKLGISLKMGTGNSVHQEKCEDFITFIKSDLGASKTICDEFRFFIWADGTLDGTGSCERDEKGNIKSRFTLSEYKKKYPQRLKKLQNFIEKHEETFIKRFVLEGRHGSKVDYIYHGTIHNGSWISSKELIKYNLLHSKINDPKDRSTLKAGRLSIQVWNISKNGKNENKRGQIQAKYPKLKNDFNELMKEKTVNKGTYFGDFEEYDLSRILNKNKNSGMWNVFDIDNDRKDRTYVVKVNSRVNSRLSSRKVYPKSDAYLIEAAIDPDFLLKNEYVIQESDLIKYNYKVVEGSGISIKRSDSKSYTIQKFTKNSFYKAFSHLIDEVELVFAGLLLYSDKKQMYKNNEIINNLKISRIELEDYFSNKNNKIKLDISNSVDINRIRNLSQKIVCEAIKEDIKLYNAIFKGEGWFKDPYYANYIYINGTIKENTGEEFYITTGSGRSNANYSIEIKPKKK